MCTVFLYLCEALYRLWQQISLKDNKESIYELVFYPYMGHHASSHFNHSVLLFLRNTDTDCSPPFPDSFPQTAAVKMVMYCPYCRNELTEPIGRSCGSCGKDIRFLAPALLHGAEQLSDEMREAALFHKYHSEDQTSEDVKDLEPGDLIEIFRGAFQHWAVYIGGGHVVHLVTPGGGSSGASAAALGLVGGQIRKDKLRDVVKTDKWKKNNIQHTTYELKPRPKMEIVKEALSMVGKDVKYSVANWNCEHFATMCRYGKARSVQVCRWIHNLEFASG
ncbi:phospholipase A and acyltransferase 5-like [Thunnus thynnus]|uniref:phospholipase A and acyltransferase 5-like n=1 Tax=Thunnus thynnus TaxID=8237 RepID=UPI003527F884